MLSMAIEKINERHFSLGIKNTSNSHEHMHFNNYWKHVLLIIRNDSNIMLNDRYNLLQSAVLGLILLIDQNYW